MTDVKFLSGLAMLNLRFPAFAGMTGVESLKRISYAESSISCQRRKKWINHKFLSGFLPCSSAKASAARGRRKSEIRRSQ
jgi:hypothetical protein